MTSLHVICGLPPQSKIMATPLVTYLMLYNGYLPPVTVTSDVIGQFYVTLFFGVELVLVMIRVGAKFRL